MALIIACSQVSFGSLSKAVCCDLRADHAIQTHGNLATSVALEGGRSFNVN